jgi:hypothetical protein
MPGRLKAMRFRSRACNTAAVRCKRLDRLNLEEQHMDRFTGGCLCGNVRIVASGLPYRLGFVTA